MLQRAASNAYSWWWASHIRTKQSKWLEHCFQEMEENVKSMLKLLEEDGDSFVQRANMYYKRRPELIAAIEESFKSFRALADRYDHLSRELQNANHTIGTVFPEQVQLSISDDEDSLDEVRIPHEATNAPQVPVAPKRLKTILYKATKELGKKKESIVEVKSGLTREEAVEEIEKSQKEILKLQTVKEFVKSSYESGVAKYWGIENQIAELQERVSRLKDEFDMEMVIEDNEARTLMAEAALKSCMESLSVLQEKHDVSSKEAEGENERIKATFQRLQSLREMYLPNQGEEDGELEVLIQKERTSEGSSEEDLTITQMAEKIDEMVNKVISLETIVSSQMVLVGTLKTEMDVLNARIRDLEEEGNTSDDTKNLGERVKEMGGMLNKIQDLNKNVMRQKSNLQTNLDDARSNLDSLSGRLSSVKPDEETTPSDRKDMLSDEEKEDVKEVHMDEVQVLDQPVLKVEREGNMKEDEDMNWEQLLSGGMEDREKILLNKYTTILKKYKDVKKKIDDKEKTENESQFDKALQIRDLKEAIQNRDEKIQYLMQKLEMYAEKNNKEVEGEEDELNFVNDPTPDAAEENDKELEGEGEDELNFVYQPTPSLSKVEEKLRMDIDALLDENLDFWLRFSTKFHQIGKFETEMEDLKNEISKIKDRRNPDGSFTNQMKSDAKPIYKHLREIQRELLLWLDQSSSLEDELERRLSSLCILQEDIAKALREGVEGDEIWFGSHQAARFQGEVLNMKQENNKVKEELKAGLEVVHGLQREIEKTLGNLSVEFGIWTEGENAGKVKVPLRSFLFGMNDENEKKMKSSIFSYMKPYKGYKILRTGMRLPS